MKTWVGFKGLRVRCIIGCLAEERVNEQDLLIDLKVRLRLEGAVQEDRPTATLDYTVLSALCETMAVNGRFQLLESLGAAIILAVMEMDLVSGLRIELSKPDALEAADAYVVLMEDGDVS